MKKKELCIFAGIFLFSLLFWIGQTLWNRFHTYTDIQIRISGALFGTYSLREDQVIEIGSGNTCEIKNGRAKMIYADCPDKLCTQQPAIDQNGGSIICLPHQVVINGIVSGNSGDLTVDGVS